MVLGFEGAGMWVGQAFGMGAALQVHLPFLDNPK